MPSNLSALAAAREYFLSCMALLQISEPGQSPNPHQRRIAVGIDLGTTHSLVASVRNGVAECLPDAQGCVILPSVVRYLAGGGRHIGYQALETGIDDPANTVASVKRFMGRSLKDVALAGKLPYQFVDHPGMLGLKPRKAKNRRSRSVPIFWRRCDTGPKTPLTMNCLAYRSPCPRILTMRSGRRPRTRPN